jgi:D-glycero-D-manno-heptose 1,7-bisphosphate phosphatase
MSQLADSALTALPSRAATLDTVFVDRDGVINVNRPGYVGSWDEFELLPGSLDALALLTRHGLRIVVVTNQACVGRSLLPRAELDVIHLRMVQMIRDHGGDVLEVLACPHTPEQGCGCRKPAPGLLQQAQERFSIDPRRAVMIGDHATDLEAARQAGTSSILVLSGRTPSWTGPSLPDGCLAVLPDLWSAATYLVSTLVSTDGLAIQSAPIEAFPVLTTTAVTPVSS